MFLMSSSWSKNVMGILSAVAIILTCGMLFGSIGDCDYLQYVAWGHRDFPDDSEISIMYFGTTHLCKKDALSQNFESVGYKDGNNLSDCELAGNIAMGLTYGLLFFSGVVWWVATREPAGQAVGRFMVAAFFATACGVAAIVVFEEKCMNSDQPEDASADRGEGFDNFSITDPERSYGFFAGAISVSFIMLCAVLKLLAAHKGEDGAELATSSNGRDNSSGQWWAEQR